MAKVGPPSHERGLGGRGGSPVSTALTWNLGSAAAAGDRPGNTEVLLFWGRNPPNWVLWEKELWVLRCSSLEWGFCLAELREGREATVLVETAHILPFLTKFSYIFFEKLFLHWLFALRTISRTLNGWFFKKNNFQQFHSGSSRAVMLEFFLSDSFILEQP